MTNTKLENPFMSALSLEEDSKQDSKQDLKKEKAMILTIPEEIKFKDIKHEESSEEDDIPSERSHIVVSNKGFNPESGETRKLPDAMITNGMSKQILTNSTHFTKSSAEFLDAKNNTRKKRATLNDYSCRTMEIFLHKTSIKDTKDSDDIFLLESDKDKSLIKRQNDKKVS